MRDYIAMMTYAIPMHCQGFQWHLKKAALYQKGLKYSFIPPIIGGMKEYFYLGGMSVADPDFQLTGGPSHLDREIRGGLALKKIFFSPSGLILV